MMVVVVAVVGVAAFMLLWRFFANPNRSDKVKKAAGIAGIILVSALLLLTATGRLHWLAALVAGALPLLRGLVSMVAAPLVSSFVGRRVLGGRLFGRGGMASSPSQEASNDGAAPPPDSTVTTDEIRMTISHESGEIDGEVLVGPVTGRRLSTLDLATLAGVLQSFQAEDSRQLLRAYLDRRFPGWEEDVAEPSEKTPPEVNGSMVKEEALAVLGLDAGATTDDVIQAHRKLMHKLHPDRGGTDYLAATLNRAKDVLLTGT